MISKNFTKYFQIPLYWLTLLVFFFLVSSLIPMLTGYFVSLLTSGTDKHEVFRIFGPNFPRLMSFLSSLAFSIALSLFLWSKILCPIGSISLAAKQVADGDFSVHVPNSKSLQAICELTDNFNRMVQELNSIESLRNDFVTTVSHEFKTPLAAIEGYATLLQDPSLSEADRNEYTRIIIDSTRQLTTMTGNILLLSRLEKQEIVTGRTTFSLDEQIRQAILLLEPLWEKKHLNLDIDLTACKFHGNCEMLQQVWINLLQNAIKFTPAGGTIRFGVERLGPEVEVSIWNSGQGISPEALPYVFQRFYKEDQSRGLHARGAGLGLNICKVLVNLSGGQIRVESKQGEWCRFVFTLPVQPPNPGGMKRLPDESGRPGAVEDPASMKPVD